MSSNTDSGRARLEANIRYPFTLPEPEHHAIQLKKRDAFVKGAEWKKQQDEDMAKVLEKCLPILRAYQLEGSYQYLIDKIQAALKKHTDI